MRFNNDLEHFLIYFYFFPRLKRQKAQSEAKKSIKETKINLLHVCSANEPQGLFPQRTWKRLCFVSFIDFFLLCLSLDSILSAKRLIKEKKNALFDAFSRNGPLKHYYVKKQTIILITS